MRKALTTLMYLLEQETVETLQQLGVGVAGIGTVVELTDDQTEGRCFWQHAEHAQEVVRGEAVVGRRSLQGVYDTRHFAR